MEKQTQDLINKWYDTYWVYMQYNGIVTKEEFEEMWVSTTNSLIEYWGKMEDGSVPKTFQTFANMLFCYIDYYARINEYYKRFGGREAVVIPNAGGRRWV